MFHNPILLLSLHPIDMTADIQHLNIQYHIETVNCNKMKLHEWVINKDTLQHVVQKMKQTDSEANI